MPKPDPAITRLADTRCHFHRDREAAARCPECGRFYCRECVTEHQNRVLCADCIQAALAPPDDARGRRVSYLLKALLLLISFLMIWFFFYYSGRCLILTPTQFHKDALWKNIE